MPKSLSFNKHGLLPKGEHELTFKELRNSDREKGIVKILP